VAKLPIQRKILREDIKEAPQWIDKVIYPVNTFFESVFNALSRNITFSENIGCQIKELEFNTTGSYDGTAAEWEELSFPKTVKFRANGVLLAQIIDLGVINSTTTAYTPIEGDVYVDWQESNEEIVIGLIRGLTLSHTYKVRFIVV
jgi:hypothetical protein